MESGLDILQGGGTFLPSRKTEKAFGYQTRADLSSTPSVCTSFSYSFFHILDEAVMLDRSLHLPSDPQ